MSVRFTSVMQLEEYLRNWVNFEWPSYGNHYDFVYMLRLFAACADNLNVQGVDAEDISEVFTAEQLKFLVELGELCKTAKPDPDARK